MENDTESIVLGLRFSEFTPIMENQIENEMETGTIW